MSGYTVTLTDREYDALKDRIRTLESDLAATEKQGTAAHEACVGYEARIRELELADMQSQLLLEQGRVNVRWRQIQDQFTRIRTLEAALREAFDQTCESCHDCNGCGNAHDILSRTLGAPTLTDLAEVEAIGRGVEAVYSVTDSDDVPRGS